MLKAERVVGTAVQISPNPTSSYCTVSYPLASAAALLTIYTVDGKKISDYNIAAGSTQRSIDVSELRSGMYFIVYKNGKQSNTCSFVK
jgi:hypothetical protein